MFRTSILLTAVWLTLFIVSTSWGQGSETTLSWDALDRLTVMESATGSTPDRPVTRVYDRDGHLITEQQGAEVLRWQHDALGRLSRRVTSWGDKQSYAWNPQGLSKLLDPTGGEHRFTQDTWGRRNGWTQAGGVERRAQFDDLDRLIGDTLAVPGGDVLVDRRLTWSDDHTVTDLAENTDGERRQQQFRYDDAGRLTGASGDRGTQSWTYDAADNLTAEAARAKHTERQYRADRLLNDSHGNDYRYDPTGRLVAREGPDGTLRLWFDDRDRLVRVHTPDDRVVHHRYDALGRRAETLAEQPSAVQEELFYWEGDNLARRVVRDAHHRTVLRDEAYTYDPEQAFRPLFRVVRGGQSDPSDEGAGEVQYYSTDQRGAVIRLSDAGGAPLWQADYDPYGRAKVTGSEAGQQPIRLMGQLHDDATGLGHHRFRVFDPESARFVSPDPLGFEGGDNAFGYPVDPVSWADPFGLANCRTMTDEQLSQYSHDLMYRDKHAQNNGGTHGLVHRYSEQVHGSMRPGSRGWDTHQQTFTQQQGALRKSLIETQRRGLQPPANGWKMASVPAPTGSQQSVPGFMAGGRIP